LGRLPRPMPLNTRYEDKVYTHNMFYLLWPRQCTGLTQLRTTRRRLENAEREFSEPSVGASVASGSLGSIAADGMTAEGLAGSLLRGSLDTDGGSASLDATDVGMAAAYVVTKGSIVHGPDIKGGGAAADGSTDGSLAVPDAAGGSMADPASVPLWTS